jgi:hypothetical protein|tara:strand:+ start:69 stop:437 length:369 start_codon:yes stop_codon:yes gene_type:complete
MKIDIKRIHNILNENHNDKGFSRSKIAELVVDGFKDLTLNLNYKMGFVITNESTITNSNGDVISIDELVDELVTKNILKLKYIGFKTSKTRRFFTIDYVEYQKLKKRRKIISKIKNTIYFCR